MVYVLQVPKLYGIVYLLRCRPTDKVYIGQHKCRKLNLSALNLVQERWNGHVRDALIRRRKGGCILLWRAMRKYGASAFSPSLLTIAANQIELDEFENKYIREFKATGRHFGYNIREGGQRGTFTKATRRKMSRIQKRLSQTPAGRARAAEAGKRAFGQHPELAKAARAVANHYFTSKIHRRKVSKQFKNIPKSKEHKAKIQAALQMKGLEGHTFGFWLVLHPDPVQRLTKSGNVAKRRWLCLCTKCNNEYSVGQGNLTGGLTKQCNQCRLGSTSAIRVEPCQQLNDCQPPMPS